MGYLNLQLPAPDRDQECERAQHGEGNVALLWATGQTTAGGGREPRPRQAPSIAMRLEREIIHH